VAAISGMKDALVPDPTSSTDEARVAASLSDDLIEQIDA
jgi:hypothetical protein